MKGYLKFFVMCLLNKEDLSGYKLIKSIGQSTGKRPSAGAIYPLLESLRKDEFISIREEGREKIYSITKKGRILYSEFTDKKQELDDKLSKMHDFIAKFTGKAVSQIIPHKYMMSLGTMSEILSKTKERHEKEALKILKEAEDKLKRISL